MHVTTVKRKGSYLKDNHAWGKYGSLGGRKAGRNDLIMSRKKEKRQ